MTTKDWIYLGLIVLTALAFYCNGYFAGVWRSRKVFDSLLDEIESEQKRGNDAEEEQVVQLDSFLARAFPGRQTRLERPRGRLPEDFHNN
jgi:hypothetical protein